MANSTVTQAVKRQSVAAALAAARTEAAHYSAWINAINRAALNLEACPWQFDGDVLIIKSATSTTRYTVDAQGCGCKAHQAGRPCWHRAARRLLVKAAEMAATHTVGTPAPASGRSFAQLQADVDALFA